MILPSYQQTPLHIAASHGHDYTVECLVKKGADISFKDKDGVSVSRFKMNTTADLSLSSLP